jgi:hypothetical protein
MDRRLLGDVEDFLATPINGVGTIFNEHGLQLELGIYLRALGYEVQFERPFKIDTRANSTKRPKRELDIFVKRDGIKVAIELKTPLSGRVPETMYDFCADLQFIEQLVALEVADFGCCILVTNDRQFWHSDLRSEGIYGFFRRHGTLLTGTVAKPTGAKDSTVFLTGSYGLALSWRHLGNSNLLRDARYLLVSVQRLE